MTVSSFSSSSSSSLLSYSFLISFHQTQLVQISLSWNVAFSGDAVRCRRQRLHRVPEQDPRVAVLGARLAHPAGLRQLLRRVGSRYVHDTRRHRRGRRVRRCPHHAVLVVRRVRIQQRARLDGRPVRSQWVQEPLHTRRQVILTTLISYITQPLYINVHTYTMK